MRQTLKKNEILRGKKSFDLLFDRGERIQGTLTRCLFLREPREAATTPTASVAFVVPRTVKRAVDRNHIKRLLREAYRRNKQELPAEEPGRRMLLLFLFTRKQSEGLPRPAYKDFENDILYFFRVIGKK